MPSPGSTPAFLRLSLVCFDMWPGGTVTVTS